MSDTSPRVLICLIAGKSSLFKVKLAGNKNIIDLRKLIKEECVLSEVASMDLILWKVRMTMVGDSTNNSLLQVDLPPPSRDERKGLTGKYVQGSVQLDEDLDDISDYWPTTTPLNPKHLHIIVEPPLGKCCVH